MSQIDKSKDSPKDPNHQTKKEQINSLKNDINQSEIKDQTTFQKNYQKNPSKNQTSSASFRKVPSEIISAIKERREWEQDKEQQRPDITYKLKVFAAALILEEYECRICKATDEPQRLFNITNNECKHRSCKNCLQQYLMYKINQSQTITCPDQNCNIKAHRQSSFFLRLPESRTKKYEKILEWNERNDYPDLKLCPSNDCASGYIDITKSQYICDTCAVQYCPQCYMKKHEGQTCTHSFQKYCNSWKICTNQKCGAIQEANPLAFDELAICRKCNHDQDQFLNFENEQEYNPFVNWPYALRIVLGILGSIFFPVYTALLAVLGVFFETLLLPIGSLLTPIYPYYYFCYKVKKPYFLILYVLLLPILLPIIMSIGFLIPLVITFMNICQIFQAYASALKNYLHYIRMMFGSCHGQVKQIGNDK